MIRFDEALIKSFDTHALYVAESFAQKGLCLVFFLIFKPNIIKDLQCFD
jgi:hypothetical protein